MFQQLVSKHLEKGLVAVCHSTLQVLDVFYGALYGVLVYDVGLVEVLTQHVSLFFHFINVSFLCLVLLVGDLSSEEVVLEAFEAVRVVL